MLSFLGFSVDPKILIIVGIYLFSFWLLVCFWVFVDSQKRFANFFISAIFFFAVLIINLPALFFYIIIRPEKENEHVFYLNHEEEEGFGGVNVPIMNFAGKDGIEMTLQLKIHKTEESGNLMPDMKVDVEMNPSSKVQAVASAKTPFKEKEKESFTNMKNKELNEETAFHRVKKFAKVVGKKIKSKVVKPEVKKESIAEKKPEPAKVVTPEVKPENTNPISPTVNKDNKEN